MQRSPILSVRSLLQSQTAYNVLATPINTMTHRPHVTLVFTSHTCDLIVLLNTAYFIYSLIPILTCTCQLFSSCFCRIALDELNEITTLTQRLCTMLTRCRKKNISVYYTSACNCTFSTVTVSLTKGNKLSLYYNDNLFSFVELFRSVFVYHRPTRSYRC